MQRERGEAMSISSDDLCWIDLAAAIIQQAIFDYENEMLVGKPARYQGDTARDIRKFFISGYGQFLSFGNGIAILRRCDRNVEIKKRAAEQSKRK